MSEYTLKNIIKFVLAVSFFAPLIVAKGFFFPFIVPKTIFFQSLVQVALLLYIFLVISNKKYLPKLDLLSKSVLVFYFIYVMSAIFGENIFRSFFGNFERMLGVVNLTHFVALFFILKGILKDKQEWIFMFRCFVFAGFLVALYGIAQKFGFSFLFESKDPRISSTIGNAAFFAAYMLFVFFISIILIQKDKVQARPFYYTVLLLSMLSIYLSETRGAILALVFSLLFLLALFVLKKKDELASITLQNKNKILAWIFGVLVLFFAVFLINQDAFYGPIKRIMSISFSDATVKTRIVSAKISAEGIKEHLILGWGPENYNLLFDKYYDLRMYPQESWFDHAHNIIFDTLSNSGILGLLSYVFVFVALFYLLFAYTKSNKDDYKTAYVIVAMMIAYFFQNLFVFDALATYLPFFLVLSFASFLTSQKEEDKIENKKLQVPIQAFVLLFLAFWFLFYNTNVRPALASKYLIEGSLYFEYGRYDLAFEYFEKSYEKSLQGKPEIATMMAEKANQIYKKENISKEVKDFFVQKAIQKAEDALKREPKNTRYYMTYASLSNAKRDDREFLKKLDKMMEENLPKSPKKPIYYFQWYQINVFLGDFKKAEQIIKKSLSQKVTYNGTLILANFYKGQKRNEDAKNTYMNFVQKRQDATVQQLVRIAVELARIGYDKEAIDVANTISKRYGYSDNISSFVQDIKNGRFNQKQ